MIERKHYQDALDVQSACNLSGVVFSFARAMQAICDSPDNTGTEFKNNHAIARLYAEQIAFLTSGREYSDAYGECIRNATREE